MQAIGLAKMSSNGILGSTMRLRESLRLKRFLRLYLGSLACLVLAGCGTLPQLPERRQTARDPLAQHVEYLSSPTLKGRGTHTAGARRARRYIEQIFQECGLRPWAKEPGFEVSYGLGKNVVGILPGSDPDLAQEIILLSAHYDHLGKDQKGRICPGAADNASGVAVLLEAARKLAHVEPRPRRTIAFAAFDAEERMLLGSFAFACRADVEAARIVGMVNVDMLGRDFLDAVTNTIFVAGTEGRSGLQQRVLSFGAEAGIRILPLGSDLIGPRSDHVAFESRGIPCLFFSCGTFRDYHKPTDTADKINYSDLARSAVAINRSLLELANGEAQPPATGSGCERSELESICQVVADLGRAPGKAGIKERDFEKLRQLQAKIDQLLSTGGYDRNVREQLIIEASGSLLPYLLPFGEGEAQDNQSWKEFLPYLEHLYLNFHQELLAGQKQLVGELVTHPPNLFRGFPPFKYEVFDIVPEEISVREAAPGVMALHALANQVILETHTRTRIWPIKAFGFSLSGTFEPLDGEGSIDELTDLCLLRLRPHATNHLHVGSMRKVLKAVQGVEPQGGYAEWLGERLKKSGQGQETDWVLACLLSANPHVMREAIGAASGLKEPRIAEAARGLVTNRSVRADSRVNAMYLVTKQPEKATLEALASVLNDSSPVHKREFMPQLCAGYPLTNSMSLRTVRPFLEKLESELAKTIGETALEHLKRLTKKDFGSDSKKWKAWIARSKYS